MRVRAVATPVAGPLSATAVEAWYSPPAAEGTRVSLSGLVTNYAGQASFRVQGVPIDGSATQVTGGPSSALGNGVRVEVSGTLRGGVLVLDKLRIRHVPGTGGPVSFSVSGTIGQFDSPARSGFRAS